MTPGETGVLDSELNEQCGGKATETPTCQACGERLMLPVKNNNQIRLVIKAAHAMPSTRLSYLLPSELFLVGSPVISPHVVLVIKGTKPPPRVP